MLRIAQLELGIIPPEGWTPLSDGATAAAKGPKVCPVLCW